MTCNYITKPSAITAKQVRENSFSFSARDFQFIPKGLKNNSIRDLIEGDFVGEQINVDEYLSYKTGKLLGTISSMNGLLFDGEKGENISPKLFAKSTKKLIKNSWLISRNASLGKISYVNNDINTILNGGISSLTFKPEFNFYVPAFFISTLWLKPPHSCGTLTN